MSVWAEPGPCVFQHIISPTRWQSTECEVGLRVGANWPQLCNLHIKLIREFIWVQVEQETLTSSLPSNKSLFPRPFEPHFEQPCLPSRRTRWQKIVLTKASDTIFWHNWEKKITFKKKKKYYLKRNCSQTAPSVNYSQSCWHSAEQSQRVRLHFTFVHARLADAWRKEKKQNKKQTLDRAASIP